MWIKICGNTNLEDARHAAAAGAQALGFVFAPSPRQVTAAQVKAMVEQLPASVETYGVFVDGSADEIARMVVACGLTGAQLHRSSEAGAAEAGMPARVRRSLMELHADEIKIISALGFSEELQMQLEEAGRDADAVLVDSRPSGGTGLRFDWDTASAAFHGARGQARVIVAGGLHPKNVEEAIAKLSPWGVDVVTGVEKTPGRKDWAKVEAFIAAVRSASAKMHAVNTKAAQLAGAAQ